MNHAAPLLTGSITLLSIIALLLAASLSALLIIMMRPFFQRYALALPNSRSSHRQPTPTGGGLAIMLTTYTVLGMIPFVQSLAATLTGHVLTTPSEITSLSPLFHVCLGAFILACSGGIDDVRPLPSSWRLLIQAASIGYVVALADPALQLLPDYPLWLERSLIILAGLWFVNLVNFMDGLDWLSVGALIPMLAFCAFMLTGAGGQMTEQGLMAVIVLGALIGFAPFNKPVAKLFLGDVGSLPLGFLIGWFLWLIAQQWGVITALLPTLYYVSDATLTLLRRLINGEKVWQAHRSHFYQRATDHGLSPLQISAHVFCLGCFLAGLGILAAMSSPLIKGVLLTVGILATGLILKRFSTPLNIRAS
jgi:UDP-N-acetylmuramyl pentapeptide phosphotransferase/UDP-N-acetylglucosamine-1-phosphate transferase